MDYQIKRSSRSLNLRISINSQAQVIVTAPKFVPEFLIKQFVHSQQAWIDDNLHKAKSRQTKLPNNQVNIFQHRYQLVYNDQAAHMGVNVQGDTIQINNLSPKSPSVLKQQLETFLKKTAHTYILTRTPALASQMGISYHKITLREQGSRWGSCSSLGNLNFNWRLVHYPPAVIDYVIIHELAHRVEMNHGAAFWRLVKQHDPEYLIHKGQLRQKRYNH